MKSSFLVHCSRVGIASFLSGTGVDSPGGPFDMAAASSSMGVVFDLKNFGIVAQPSYCSVAISGDG